MTRNARSFSVTSAVVLLMTVVGLLGGRTFAQHKVRQRSDQHQAQFKGYRSGDTKITSVSPITLVFRESPPDLSKPLDDPVNQPSENIILTGFILVRRGDPEPGKDGRWQIPQEILDADGIGFSRTLNSRIRLTQHSKKRSVGKTVQLTAGVDFPAKSYFDINFQIVALDRPDLPVLETSADIHIASAEISSIPPLGHTYAHHYGQNPVALVDDSGRAYAWLVEGQKVTIEVQEAKSLSH